MNRDDHLLVMLIEECAEVQQAATKILRFGMDSSNPKIPYGIDNLEHLKNELHDLKVVLSLLNTSGNLMIHYDSARIDRVLEKKRHYMQVALDIEGCKDAKT